MDVETGAMASLHPKLVELLNDKYKLQGSIRQDVEHLSQEIGSMNAYLLKVADVPRYQLHEDVKLWAGKARKLSYEIEVYVDKFLRSNDSEGFKRLIEKMGSLLSKGKTPSQIFTSAIKEIKAQVQQMTKLCEQYECNLSVVSSEALVSIDPRIVALYKEVDSLVGIYGKRNQELMKLLLEGGEVSSKKLKIVSVVGFGGLGKTTLVKTVYDKIKSAFDFECSAFVPVGQNADVKKVLRDIIIQVSMYGHHLTIQLDEQQLIEKLGELLENKRYLIVIDDIWNEKLWGNIKYAFSDKDNLGSRIITTTRIGSVSKACCSSANDSIYQMEPLSNDDSKKLLYDRISASVSGCHNEFQQISSDILKKCGGVPLAIITMASILTSNHQSKPKDGWHLLLSSIGRGGIEDGNWDNMLRILSFSYYELPPYLKTCLLYLSIFPGAHRVLRDRLVKKLVAEGIVTQETKLIRSSDKNEAKLSRELSLEEAASEYLDELVNRNVLHTLQRNNNGEVISYHIHPMMHSMLKAIAIDKNFAASLDLEENSEEYFNYLEDVRSASPHLSINCPDSENLNDLPSMAFNGGVRSLTIFGHANRILLMNFKDIQLLDLEGCKSIERGDVVYICSMILLKQLCLAKTDITELPPEIGNLKYLEGLDLGETKITHLPPEIGKLQNLKSLDARKSQVTKLPNQVVRLTRMVHLLIGDHESCEGVKLPDGIGRMKSLQRLCTIDLRKCSLPSLKDLVELPYLKEIAAVLSDEPEETRVNDVLLSSLNKSTKLRSLMVCSDFRLKTVQSSSTYKYLICRKKLTVLRSLKIPIFIAGQSFLSTLDIRVCKLDEDGLKILRDLPRLQSLVVRLEVLPTRMIRISCEGFAKLESFYVDCRMPRLTFEEGAMPNLKYLELKLYTGSDSKEHMGIRHLLNLQEVTLWYSEWYATNKGVKETNDSVKIEANEHQNNGVEETDDDVKTEAKEHQNKCVEEITDAINTEAKEHQSKGVKETTDAVKIEAKEHQNKGVKETINAVKVEAKDHRNKITLCIVEEGKDGKCAMEIEIFEENKDASCSKMTEIEEEKEGHADGTGYFLTQEGDLHQSSRDIASCSGTSEIEEVVA